MHGKETQKGGHSHGNMAKRKQFHIDRFCTPIKLGSDKGATEPDIHRNVRWISFREVSHVNLISSQLPE